MFNSIFIVANMTDGMDMSSVYGVIILLIAAFIAGFFIK